MPDRRYRITGRVQGVFFRASTREVALRLGLDGHAVNLADGSVEVLASGTEAAQQRLHAWLLNGPPSARVERVSVEEAGSPAPPGFATG